MVPRGAGRRRFSVWIEQPAPRGESSERSGRSLGRKKYDQMRLEFCIYFIYFEMIDVAVAVLANEALLEIRRLISIILK
uniref:Uncharacterized protein n=1 Tax=Romanomermis culicivorax TaxID=13658 RepID=A0A915IA31_ROMCU